MISLQASMTCRSKSYVCLAMRSAVFITFLPARGAQCRLKKRHDHDGRDYGICLCARPKHLSTGERSVVGLSITCGPETPLPQVLRSLCFASRELGWPTP